MEKTDLGKNERQVVALLRGSAEASRIDDTFKNTLKHKLIGKRHVSRPGFFERNRFLFSALAMFMIIIPITVAFVLLQPNKEADTTQSPGGQANDQRVTPVHAEDFQELKVEFGNAINSKSSELLELALANEVELQLYTTGCCGKLPKADAMAEILFQLQDKNEYDFAAEGEQMAKLRLVRGDLEDFGIGVSGDEVIAYGLNTELEVDRIFFAKYNQLVGLSKEEVISSFIERLNGGDFAGIEQLLAENVRFRVMPEGCCEELNAATAAARVQSIFESGLPFDFETEQSQQIKINNPEFGEFELGVNAEGEVIGFLISEELHVETIVSGNLKQFITDEQED
jgi:hypothetical protein